MSLISVKPSSMRFTKHWAKIKNWMENQEDSLLRIKWEVPLNLGMGNYYWRALTKVRLPPLPARHDLSFLANFIRFLASS